MKIAVIGTRGVPARYGGFETCAQELSVGLVKKGHSVFVYSRFGNEKVNPKTYKRVRLVYIPHIDSKNVGTLSHAFFSFIHSLFQNYDMILAFNVGIAPLCIIPKLFAKKIILNVDGLEWKRRKWGWLGKTYFKICERLASHVIDGIITDSKSIKKYYKDNYHTLTKYISYGAYIGKSQKNGILKKYSLRPFDYFLIVSRLEPENNADLIIKAFKQIKTNKNLVIIGNVPYKSQYVEELKKLTDSRVKFLSPIYDKDHLKELYCDCYAYIHGNEVGGTNPALLQALGYCSCVLTINVPFNREVVKNSAILFEKSTKDLKEKMEYILKNPDVRRTYQKKAVERIKNYYQWEKVIDDY